MEDHDVEPATDWVRWARETILSVPRHERSETQNAIVALLGIIEQETARLLDPHCYFAGPNRGDCTHFIGLPGLDQDVDHDGPRTEDEYGKPNGWCWFCWQSHRIEVLQAALACLDLSYVHPTDPQFELLRAYLRARDSRERTVTDESVA
jgi:hypothetical protein